MDAEIDGNDHVAGLLAGGFGFLGAPGGVVLGVEFFEQQHAVVEWLELETMAIDRLITFLRIWSDGQWSDPHVP